MKKFKFYLAIVVDDTIIYESDGKGTSELTWIRKGMNFLKEKNRQGEIWVKSAKIGERWKIYSYTVGDAWPTFRTFY